MIVNSTISGWDIIFQAAHGLLAGMIADAFDESLHCKYWRETKVAIHIHDDGKEPIASETSNYLTPGGAPRNFTDVDTTSKQRVREAKSALETAYRKHTWIGILKSLHLSTLYQEVDVDSELAELLEDEEQCRQKLLKHLSMKKTDLAYAYSLMRWCDRCSLILCQNQLPPMQRKLEIITLPNDQTYTIWQREDETVGIEPWPFSDSQRQFSVEYRELKQLQFKNEKQFAEQLWKASPSEKKWQFVASE